MADVTASFDLDDDFYANTFTEEDQAAFEAEPESPRKFLIAWAAALVLYAATRKLGGSISTEELDAQREEEPADASPRSAEAPPGKRGVRGLTSLLTGRSSAPATTTRPHR